MVMYNKNLPFHARHLGLAPVVLTAWQVEDIHFEDLLHVPNGLLVWAGAGIVGSHGGGDTADHQQPPDHRSHGRGGVVRDDEWTVKMSWWWRVTGPPVI